MAETTTRPPRGVACRAFRIRLSIARSSRAAGLISDVRLRSFNGLHLVMQTRGFRAMGTDIELLVDAGHLGLFMGRAPLRDHWAPLLRDVAGAASLTAAKTRSCSISTSPSRRTDRARIRLATLEQAMIKTSPLAANSTSRTLRAPDVI